MDYRQFIAQLPAYYEHWGRDRLHPRSQVWQDLQDSLQSDTPASALQLLNLAVAHLEAGEIYCQVGYPEPASLVGALLHHPDAMAYAVHDFSSQTGESDLYDGFVSALGQAGISDQVGLCDQSADAFFHQLRQMGSDDAIGVYVEHGAQDYRDCLLRLLLVQTFLANQAVMILVGSNSSAIQQAIWDFLMLNPQSQSVLTLPIANGIHLLTWDREQGEHYDYETLKQHSQPQFIQALRQFQREFGDRQSQVDQLYRTALQDHQAGHLEQAEQAYHAVLSLDAHHADGWRNLGLLYYMQGVYDRALDAVLKAVKIEPNQAVQHYSLGLVLEQGQEYAQAIQAYQTAIALDATFTDAYNNLGNLLTRFGQEYEAESVYRSAIATNPNHLGSYLNLGNLLMAQSRAEEAIAIYQTALTIEATHYDVLNNLALAYFATNQHQEAAKVYETALSLYPDAIELRFENQRLLPVLYESEAEIHAYRQRFTHALDGLIRTLRLDQLADRQAAIRAISRGSNFYLAYQNENDLELQKKYGELVHHIMIANYPQLVAPRPMPPLTEHGKIRVGYISGFMRLHSVAKTSIGYFKYCDRNQFEIYSYYTDTQHDSFTDQFKSYSDHFREYDNPSHYFGEQIDDPLEAIAQQIIDDQLHILVHLDLGMNVLAAKLAGLRLAPIQCSVGSHPITSGSPVIDYFISSDLMEPEDADSQYSETLIRLPNLGFAYPKPNIPAPTQTRADFGLRDDAVIYLSCQSLYKYLPQHDDIFAAIAQRVPNAQIAFLAANTGTYTTQTFRQRLQHAFARVGLDSEHYCVILPRQDQVGFFQLNQVVDVFLDGLSWSGCNTTFETSACHVPVVTRPGRFMRGRHAYAILTMMGMTETIARDEAEYVEIAVKLGCDRQWRQSIIEQIRQRYSIIYDDRQCVQGLDAFYQHAVRSVVAQAAMK